MITPHMEDVLAFINKHQKEYEEFRTGSIEPDLRLGWSKHNTKGVFH